MQRSELREQIRELVQRWLPMLLGRIGVPKRETAMLREVGADPDDLRKQLDLARRAVESAVTQTGEGRVDHAELAESAVSIVAGLRLALDLQYRDLSSAQRCVANVKRGLFALLVVGPSSAGRLARRPSSWLSRLLSRDVNSDAAVVN